MVRRRDPRLGDEFLTRLDALLKRIGSEPYVFQEVEPRVRRGLLRQFPYAVYYLPEEEPLSVIAVLHTSRQPDYWKGGPVS